MNVAKTKPKMSGKNDGKVTLSTAPEESTLLPQVLPSSPRKMIFHIFFCLFLFSLVLNIYISTAWKSDEPVSEKQIDRQIFGNPLHQHFEPESLPQLDVSNIISRKKDLDLVCMSGLGGGRGKNSQCGLSVELWHHRLQSSANGHARASPQEVRCSER